MKTLIVHNRHDGAVCYEDSRIIDIGLTEELLRRHDGAKIIDASKKIVMPGLINTHLHSGLIRGTAEDLKVWAD